MKKLLDGVGTSKNEETAARYDEETNRRFYGSAAWREICRRVRAFFGYKCVRCGAKGGAKELTVHHLHGRLEVTRAARIGEDGALIGELICCCESCHRFLHENVPSAAVDAYVKKMLAWPKEGRYEQ